MHQRRPGTLQMLASLSLLVLGAVSASNHAREVGANSTLHIVFPSAETGFDPQALGDTYSYAIAKALFDAPYKYDYFARPVRVVPNTAAAMPEITDDGRTYTIVIRPGIVVLTRHLLPDFEVDRRKQHVAVR